MFNFFNNLLDKFFNIFLKYYFVNQFFLKFLIIFFNISLKLN